MTAVLYDDATELTWIDLSSSPALGLQPRLVQPLPRPARLRVAPAPTPAPLVAVPYVRRRILAALTAVLVVAALAVTLLQLTTGSASPTSADASGAAGVAAPLTYTVRAGDTLWSIASKVAPDVDVRVTVDRLVRLNGPAPIVLGQQLDLP
jgi:hypothetical protein